jgi:hypothetical protein
MMEGFIINIVGTIGFSGIFLMVFFSIYYLYLGKDKDKDRNKDEDKNKRLGKRILK